MHESGALFTSYPCFLVEFRVRVGSHQRWQLIGSLGAEHQIISYTGGFTNVLLCEVSTLLSKSCVWFCQWKAKRLKSLDLRSKHCLFCNGRSKDWRVLTCEANTVRCCQWRIKRQRSFDLWSKHCVSFVSGRSKSWRVLICEASTLCFFVSVCGFFLFFLPVCTPEGQWAGRLSESECSRNTTWGRWWTSHQETQNGKRSKFSCVPSLFLSNRGSWVDNHPNSFSQSKHHKW